uniref:Uncharacterized protein n=1 Tax=Ditylenchus dipsaci TaxID=166011 RepID=A0A915DYC2_9BILA
MELYFFRRPEYQRLYNCSIYDVEEVPLEKRQHILPGIVFIALFMIFITLYIPCLAFFQALVISGVNATASGLYDLMQWLPVSEEVILLASYTWFLVHGLPPQRSLGYFEEKSFDQTIYCISLEKEDLELGGLDLTDVFQELHVKFLDHFCDQVWIYGIKELTDMYKEWSYKHKRDGRLDARDTNFYYMVPDVIQELKRTELHLHPDFYFDEVNFEKDLDLITKSWHLSMPQESEQFKQKFTLLPYSLVREKGTEKLASFEAKRISSMCGGGFMSENNQKWRCAFQMGRSMER